MGRPGLAWIALALAAGTLLLSACDRHYAQSRGGARLSAPGVLVFSGVPFGSYLHAIRPDGTRLEQLALPENCSPSDFTRDGRVVRCDEWADPWGVYAAEGTNRGWWRRIRLPLEWRFPSWITKGMRWDSDFAIDAPQWSPAHDRIALILRPDAPFGDIWFSGSGNVVIADRDGTHRRVVAKDGEVPAWSPDGRQLAFARCRVSEADPTAAAAEDSAECSIWVVSAYDPYPSRRIADGADSAPAWSPDGKFVAFFRNSSACAAICRRRIVAIAAENGEEHTVGPTLMEPSQLFWLPASAQTVKVTGTKTGPGPLQLQRCVDVWNRARMQWPRGVANVRFVKSRCEVTVAQSRDHGVLYTGFRCRQPVRFSFQCPSHGGQLRTMNPQQRIWNAQIGEREQLRLIRAPKGPHLPVPKVPPYPLLDGWILPFTSHGRRRPGLIVTRTVSGSCIGPGAVRHPDSVRCGWDERGFSYIANECFKPPGRLQVGDAVLCAESAGSTRFIQLKVAKLQA